MDATEYKNIYSLVKRGFTIGKACKRVGLTTTEYYKEATEEQKAEVRYIKSTTLSGLSSHRFDTKNLDY